MLKKGSSLKDKATFCPPEADVVGLQSLLRVPPPALQALPASGKNSLTSGRIMMLFIQNKENCRFLQHTIGISEVAITEMKFG